MEAQGLAHRGVAFRGGDELSSRAAKPGGIDVRFWIPAFGHLLPKAAVPGSSLALDQLGDEHTINAFLF